MITKNKLEGVSSLEIKTIEKNNISIKEELLKSAEKGIIDNSIEGNLALMPKLLVNDYKQGNKILSNIISELESCRGFMISVAFITSSGITPLLQTLKDLEDKGVKGQILTTDYLNFSEPKALKRLLEFSNLEIKLYDKESFHTKGYIFQHSDCYKIIVGSSNLTQTALTKNKEWNIKVSSLEEGALTEEVIDDFQLMWQEANELTIEWIETYEKIYFQQREYTRKSKVPSIVQYKLRPNKMQVSAIKSLDNIREKGEAKALLISATGTGKTYLSAFDLRNVNPQKALFIVHREQIAKQALESYRNVFGDTKTMGILSGNYKEVDKEFIFSTVQTLCKDEILSSFENTEFDYIIIDEVHKAGAVSYQKIVSHFKPKFLLGMTATPERNDDFNIFEMFDYNIAYEIRLQQALEEDLLCPFHYFGIEDISIDGKGLDENTDFKYLVQDQRVEHIIEKAKFYGYCGNRVKGLIFCSNKEEAKELSNKFNNRGYKTLALTGDNNQKERENAIERLEQEEIENSLEYIFTVDIFNEGVDIPCVNQVIMLRATKSAIIFVQQLGRGLRKHTDKEYIVVIDFVGNYDSNFLIPIALSGDRTYNKDNVRKYVMEGNRVIPGCSTINFDKISKKRIFESIDKVKFNQVSFIKENYKKLKEKLGKIPSLKDFDTYESIDPLRIFENNSLGSYHKFLLKYEKEYSVHLDNTEELFIEFISKKLASGKRIHELLMIKQLMEYETNALSRLKASLKEIYNIDFKESTAISIINVLTNEFPSGTGKKTYEKCIFLEQDNEDYKISKVFKEKLQNQNFANVVKEAIDFGISRYEKDYSIRYMDTNFMLYKKYTYEDVCRLLEWEKCEVATNIGGYKFNKKTKTYPVFINYDKAEDISSTIKYEDRFLSPAQIIAISKSGRTKNSPDVVQAYNAEKDNVEMSLFVRKNKDDKVSKEFYYLGKINTVGEPKEFIMENTNKRAVEITYRLHTPVREDLYRYIV
ncbi:DUF3427 domain-containing protein [Oceanirhabdus seepicola]|uniref:DEAD/DEAH box helicase n=1 Tax=Oceanirhabdus seepicola TaxID=2828781 RepID=A0A9J6NWD9_9CLOT|nr:DEAD/DEAH box helicase [Oceanirhabdus seepicola]MCM1988815.1 DEAD/DEAH box helicase [Oceanirhabdus seepicola]